MAYVTSGACIALRQGRPVSAPVLQVVMMEPRPVDPAGHPLELSDGQFHLPAKLAPALSHLVNASLQLGCLVRLTRFQGGHGGDQVIQIQALEVVSGPHTLIGAPEDIETAGAALLPAGAKPEPTAAAAAYQPHHAPVPQRPAQPQPYPQPTAAPQHWPPHQAAPAAPQPPAPAASTVQPIVTLSPFLRQWCIVARVTKKGPPKSWSNARGEGRLFSVDLADAHGGQIRCTFFRGAVDKYLDVVQENGVYEISGGSVKTANRQFSTIDFDYELALDDNSTVVPLPDDGSIPHPAVALKSVRQLAECPRDSVVDVLGILMEVQDVSEITSKKSGELFRKREVCLLDDSGASVRLTLWREVAEGFAGRVGDALLVRGARVSDFGGVTLSSTTTTSVTLSPALPQAGALLHWWATQQRHGPAQPSVSLSRASSSGSPQGPLEFKTLAQVETEGLGRNSEQGVYFMLRCTLTLVRSENMWYPACAVCNKKVTQLGHSWQCSKCQSANAEMEPRYILNLTVNDCTGSRVLTAFNDVGGAILGHTAKDLSILQQQDPHHIEAVLHDVTFKPLLLKCRAAEDHRGMGRGVQVTVMEVRPMDWVGDSRELLRTLQAPP